MKDDTPRTVGRKRPRQLRYRPEIFDGCPSAPAPTVVLPYLNSAQAAHPAYQQSLDRLRAMGVLIGSCEPHRPKAGGGADRYRWEEAVELLAPRVAARP